MSSGLVFQHIGFTGHQSGVASLSSAGIAWADRTNTAHETLEKEKILRMTWTVFGPKAHIVVYLTDGSFYRLDGFEKNKFDEISQYLKSVLGVTLEKGSVATGGSQFGEISFNDKSVSMISGAKQVFEMRLDSVAQCVMGNNRNEVEIQFVDNDTVGDADMISQIRLYFPPGEEEEDLSRAEEFQRSVMERGSLRSITGDVIVEFTKEQGNFVTPRGRYGVQMYSTFLRMHGEKYEYKVQYEDIDKLFLLHRPDGYTSAVVISLKKPIRQGNQRYAHLVIQSTREEHTITVNLTEEEIASKYDNQLTPEMTMPMSSLIAKIFKVLTQSKVFVPKNYKSDREAQAVKCSVKANDGLLFPLEKSLIFIHKPTFIIAFSDIEAIEFQRYQSGASATRNFDLAVSVRASSEADPDGGVSSSSKQYVFSSIDRAEYNNLYDFLESKKLPIKTPKQDAVVQSFAELSEGEGEVGIGDMGSMDSEEEDDDYEAGKSSGSGSGSDDSEGSDAEEDGDQGGKAEKSSSSKKRKRSSDAVEVKAKDKDKVKTVKKDKNAPKKGKSAYNYFVEELIPKLKAENPDSKVSDLMRQAGESWKAISAEEKSAYEAKAEGDKLRYKQEMKSYAPAPASEEEDGDTPKKKKRAKKDKNAPKNALSAYIIFTTEQRSKILAANPSMKSTDIMRECGNLWRALSAEDKAPYEAQALADKERYSNEMKAYAASGNRGGTGEEEAEPIDSDDLVDSDDAN